MLGFAKRLPDLFTHKLCPLATLIVPAKQEGDEEAPSATPTEKPSEGGKPQTSTSGNVNKNEKKKRKKANLAAASNKAMGGKLDASCADPATWPRLNLTANSQLRLFVARCDPSPSVASDADRSVLISKATYFSFHKYLQ